MTIIVIHNTETGEIVEREMTAAELSQHKKDVELGKAELQAKKDKEIAREAARNKLLALGLDTDNLKAIGLG